MKTVRKFKDQRHDQCAVTLGNLVIVIGGQSRTAKISTRVVWSYNLYTEEWRNHEIPDTSCAPEPFHGAVAAVIAKTIYTFGGRNSNNSTIRNKLWTLSRSKGGLFTWSECHCKGKLPTPRAGHTGWEYSGKLWVFAGKGPSPDLDDDYLNDHGDSEGFKNFAFNNQLLCFHPSIELWTNPQCSGSVPTPRSDHASTIISDIVWLFGGCNHNGDYLGDMYELKMNSLTWSQIETVQPLQPHPTARAFCTLTAVTYDKLVLHGGCVEYQPGMRTTVVNDTWIMDLASHSWRQFTSREDHTRKCHTGSTGLNNVIIIGGYNEFDITYYKVWNNTLNVMLGPKSLQQVAMQAIHKHRNKLPVDCLPKKLLSLLGISVKKVKTFLRRLNHRRTKLKLDD